MYKIILFDFSTADGSYEHSARIVGTLTDPELIQVALERIYNSRERELSQLRQAINHREDIPNE